MKELNALLKDTIAIHGQTVISKYKDFVTSLQIMPGQTCFELNMQTAEILPAIYDKEHIEVVTKKNLITDEPYTTTVKKREIIQRPGYLYITALNVENARRKFIDVFRKFGAKYPVNVKS